MSYYDYDANPISLIEWGLLLAARHDPRSRGLARWRVGEDVVGDYVISTVWIGLDYNWTGHGAPLIFETMAFREGEDGEVLGRYSTSQQAEQMHAYWIEKYRERWTVLEDARNQLQGAPHDADDH